MGALSRERESHPVGNVASVVALPPCTRLFSTHRGYVDYVFKTERATPHRTHRLATRDGMGANDGIVSTASLVLGVAPAHATHSNILIAGVAGAMSMAAGEYVSVHSQADTEQADLALERTELKLDAPGEHRELSAIYVGRGLDPALAKKVADQRNSDMSGANRNKSADTA